MRAGRQRHGLDPRRILETQAADAPALDRHPAEAVIVLRIYDQRDPKRQGHERVPTGNRHLHAGRAVRHRDDRDAHRVAREWGA